MSFIDKNNLSTFSIGVGLFIGLPLFIIVMIYFFSSKKGTSPKSLASPKSSDFLTPRSGPESLTYADKGTSPKSSASSNSSASSGSHGSGTGRIINKKSFLNLKNILLIIIGITIGYIIEKSQKLISF